MTREQNIVIMFYGLFAAISAGIHYHSFSTFFMVGFTLAFVQKIVNCIPKGHDHHHGLVAAPKEN